MALYWPEKKVALDIIDDPRRRPFDAGEGWQVVEVTCAELENYETFLAAMVRVGELLGQSVPTDPKWKRTNRQLHKELFPEAA